MYLEEKSVPKIEDGTAAEVLLTEDGGETKQSGYQEYRALGGIINEAEYVSALEKMKETGTADSMTTTQAGVIARVAGIEFGANDPRVVLYGILRNDANTSGAEHHHSQMSDQQLFVEALRMLEDKESVQKVIQAHPHISFEYGKE